MITGDLNKDLVKQLTLVFKYDYFRTLNNILFRNIVNSFNYNSKLGILLMC